MHKKNIIVIALFSFLLVILSLTSMLAPGKSYSETERRSLQQFPKLNLQTLRSGEFMDKFEIYAQDNFVGRTSWTSAKANVMRYAFGLRDNNGLYQAKGYWSKLEYPLPKARLEQSLARQQNVYETYLAGTDCQVYMALIPDKNYYLAPLYSYPTMDYDAYVRMVKENTGYAKYIDLFSVLSLEDFYHTDQHWRQENLQPVVKQLADAMGFAVGEYEENQLEMSFYGTYYRQAGLSGEPDEIHYLTNAVIRDSEVKIYQDGKMTDGQVYNMQKASGRDPYDFFLEGTNPVITMENPHAKSDRKLVIFRDSFASSLTPLLLEDYAQITLIDLRYMKAEAIPQFVDFSNQDVLFLYSTLTF